MSSRTISDCCAAGRRKSVAGFAPERRFVLPLVMRSENQPAVSEPTKPQKNGIDAAMPVCMRHSTTAR